MATITIRNLDESLKRQLRIRAASHGRSMEDEARRILRAALEDLQAPSSDLKERIRRRFAKLGDVDLPIVPREPVREPEVTDNRLGARKLRSADAGVTKTRRSR